MLMLKKLMWFAYYKALQYWLFGLAMHIINKGLDLNLCTGKEWQTARLYCIDCWEDAMWLARK